MEILKAMLLGLVQGIAEFLPISSSGHLVIFRDILGFDLGEQNMIFDILLHVGTLVSVVVFYWSDVKDLFFGFFRMIGGLFKGNFDFGKDPSKRFILLLIIATLPLFVAVLLESKIEKAFSSVLLVGCLLMVTGVLLFITDRLKAGSKDQSNTKYRSAFFVGLIQLIAVLPGISRSGSTIFAGTLVGMKKEFAVKFSLLLSLIAIVGAVVTQVPDVIAAGAISVSPASCIAGMAVSAVSGFLAIKFLVALLTKGKFRYISYYCWVVGVIAIVSQLIK